MCLSRSILYLPNANFVNHKPISTSKSPTKSSHRLNAAVCLRANLGEIVKKRLNNLYNLMQQTGWHYNGVKIMLLCFQHRSKGVIPFAGCRGSRRKLPVATFVKARKRLSRCSSNRLSLKPPINLANRALMLKVRR